MKLVTYCIAKNEAINIGGMIESVRGVSSGIWVCDTGSTDATVEVAKKYTDKILVHPRADEWRENPAKFSFAEARNYVLDAIDTPEHHPDWILSIDCDERLSAASAELLVAFLASVGAEIEVVLPSLFMCHDDGLEYQRFSAERIWRGGHGIRFEGAMHNWLAAAEGTDKRIAHGGIEIHHNRALKSEASRAERGAQRLKMAETHFLPAIKKNKNDRRSIFYLAGTYFDCQKYKQAARLFEKYLASSDWAEERYQAGYLLSRCYVNLDNPEKARQVAQKYALEDFRRAELFCMLGEFARKRGDSEQAEWWFKLATLRPMHLGPMFVERDAHT